MEAMPEGTQIRSLALPLAHQLVFPISPIHIAQSLMAAAAAGRGHVEQSKWLPSPAGLPACLQPLVLVRLDGWLVAPSVRPLIVGVMQL